MQFFIIKLGMCKNKQVKRSERVYASVKVRQFRILVPDIAQWVKHLSSDSGSPGSNLHLVSHYFYHPITFGSVPNPGTGRLTLSREKTWVDLCKYHLKGRNVAVGTIQIAWVGYESIARLAPDQRFRGPVFKFQSGLSLFLPSHYARLS